ncbi:MAG TPA: PH domain-containing protein [Candidatus Ruthenibacterium merdigallinarum]|nr:PH domain-containing protein [Candidatus Ruthenibacterium merdigallinarum]
MRPAEQPRICARRFHLLHVLRYFRYGLLLCLVPIVRALLALDVHAVFAALYQDALILALTAAGALALWRTTSLSLENGVLCASSGLFFKTRRVYAASSIAAIEIARPVYCRLFGASHVTIHPKNLRRGARLRLYLSRSGAEALADALMPARQDTSLFAPTGFERLNFVVLSANVLTGCAFAVMAARHLEDVFDDFHHLAAENLSRLTALAARWLPAGLAALTALGFCIAAITVLYAFFRTFGFSVCRNGDVLIARGGLLSKTERRIRVSCVTLCEVRVTPAARLLRRCPVYVRAGSFNGSDIPLMLCRDGAEDSVQMLLPAFRMPPMPAPSAQRMPLPFLWKSAALLALFLGMTGVAFASERALLPVPLLGAALAFASLLVSLEGVRREGFCKNKNRSLSACYTKRFTRHDVCILTSDVSYSIWETPFGVSAGLCHLTAHLPCAARVRVRAVPTLSAMEIPFTL